MRPGVRNLQHHGDPATGVVVEARPGAGGRQKLTILAKLPGGVEQTITRTVTKARTLAPGDHVPLRYDRANPSRVEVDVDTLRSS